VEIVLGRYLSYGILSAMLFFKKGTKSLSRFTPKAWGLAFLFALISNIIYYLGIVAGLRFASSTLTILVVGMAPITISLYANFRTKEIAYRDLSLPCLWIGFGLVLVNITEVDWSFKAASLMQYFLGLAGIGAALVTWSLFAVHNARFLKRHPHIQAGEWTTIIGVATLCWTILIGCLFAISMPLEVNFSKFFTLSEKTLRYLGGVLLLGFLCSWVGCYLWSRASLYLPTSLMGALLIFETLFGLCFVFTFEKILPSWIELAGVASMVGGILMSIKSFRRKPTAPVS
jgi:drug/metabolite transporter (DMT)-like permease